MLFEDIYYTLAQHITSIDVINNMRLSSKLLFNSMKYVRKLEDRSMNLMSLFDKNSECIFPNLMEITNNIVIKEADGNKFSLILLRFLIKRGLKKIKIRFIFNEVSLLHYDELEPLSIYTNLIYEVESLFLSFTDFSEKYYEDNKYSNIIRYHHKSPKTYNVLNLLRNTIDNNTQLITITQLHTFGYPSIRYLIDKVKYEHIPNINFSVVLNNSFNSKLLLKIENSNIVSFIIDSRFSILHIFACIQKMEGTLHTLIFSNGGLILFLETNENVYDVICNKIFSCITHIIITKDNCFDRFNSVEDKIHSTMKHRFPRAKLTIR